ncbi:MAG TPA: tRNA pseudouridine(13) synthase TruD [Polyangiaceae bacterium]|nr:tRNA pseudouridine(13) synthase TruD [Polyangiaceae bacterium]
MTLPRARLKASPEDFVVEEIPAYAASGAGEHVFVTIKKRGLTTAEAARRLADALGVSVSQVSWAGLKDKVAVTTQTLSIQFPIAKDAEAPLRGAGDASLEILDVRRHGNKLKPGHLEGNRFDVRLRELDDDGARAVEAALLEIGRVGAPNFFGAQRFGHGGRNVDYAKDILAGRARPPKDRRKGRLVFSALQSELFNQVLDARLADGTWTTVIAGDLAKKEDTGGLFLVPSDAEALADATLRAAERKISATGPMFGAKMRWPEGAVLELERRVLDGAGLDDAALDRARALGEGTRRPLRIPVEALSVEREPGALRVRFTLPKGAYATTVLGRAAELDETREVQGAESAEQEADTADPS